VLTIILNFVLPVVLYVIVFRASQAHDNAIRRASYAAHNAVSVNGSPLSPPPPPPPKIRSFYHRVFGLLSPSSVDRRLEALSAAHTGDANEPHAHARLSHLLDIRHMLDVKAPPESPLSASDDALYGHHAGDPLRTAAPPDGERDEIEDAELVPGISGVVSPVTLAYTIGVFAVVINVITLALQIDGVV
jgi:hypothetical protein